ALEASMERENRDELLTEMNKSCKRKHADQDPSPPPLDSDLSKRRRHDTDASAYHSLKLLSHQHGRKTANISDSKDTNSAHLLKFKQRPKWLKPIPDDERPVTPEPTWVIPSTHTPDAVNNWANALATMYQAPAKNSLLKKSMDMRTFMHNKGSGHALLISKMKVARYLDFGLELLVLEHMCINE
nr:hypothetical protein [Tanacetum cinerariifolium]